MAAPRPVDVLDHVDDQDEVITGEAVALQIRPASFVQRAAGSAIDFIVYYTVSILILVGFYYAATSLGMDPALAQAIQIVGTIVGLVVIPMTVELVTQGKSLGRLALGVRIVRDDGGAVAFRQSFIRAIIGLIEIFLVLGTAPLVGLLSAKSKRLGDMLAGTYSQQERISGTPAPVFGVPYQLVDWSRTADVARMPDSLARRISQFLGQSAGLTPESRRRLSIQLANEAAPYVSPLPSGTDPELFLAAISVVRREREFAALQLEQRTIERLRPALEGRPHNFPDRG